MKKTNETFFNHLLLVIAGTMMTLACATVVANFGWTQMISIISCGLTALVYCLISILWKN